jgi:hypothetical protein
MLLLGASPALRAGPATIHQEDNRLEVRWRGDLLVEIRDGRYLRFRANGFNDHWIGTAAAPMDLGWDYAGVKDYAPVRNEVEMEEGGFTIILEGSKPSIDGLVRTQIRGRLDPATNEFHYTLGSRLTASQDKWRKVSARARRVEAVAAVPIEALDFHLNRISRSDLMDWRNAPGDTRLYEGIVLAHKGEPWRFIPPVYTPFPIRPGTYPTIFWNHDRLAEAGLRIGYLDRREGGWIQELLQSSAPIRLEQCWLGVDVHHRMLTGVPGQTGPGEVFEVSYTFGFKPVSRPGALQILQEAVPIAWQDRPEYQLPVFSRYSTFEEKLSRSGQFVWCASSYQCAMDDTVGFDDRHSIRITHVLPGEKSAWSAFTWGTYFDTPTLLKGRFRISAMVKTAGLSGEFRLAVSKHPDGSWLRPSGEWISRPVQWFYSPTAITGTNDWTRMHVDVDIDLTKEPPFTRHSVVLEYTGAGSIWFDNVRIQQSD